MKEVFADRLIKKIEESESLLIAGFDPVYEQFPQFLKKLPVIEAVQKFYEFALLALTGKISSVKPNIAFFEQYGVAGLEVYARICAQARAQGFLVISDIKRGDIGSTAQAYAKAFLPAGAPFESDAITVNPYLGFDTVDVFLESCVEHGKGIFVLLRTSNPGSQSLQGTIEDQNSPLVKVSKYLGENDW